MCGRGNRERLADAGKAAVPRVYNSVGGSAGGEVRGDRDRPQTAQSMMGWKHHHLARVEIASV